MLHTNTQNFSSSGYVTCLGRREPGVDGGDNKKNKKVIFQKYWMGFCFQFAIGFKMCSVFGAGREFWTWNIADLYCYVATIFKKSVELSFCLL